MINLKLFSMHGRQPPRVFYHRLPFPSLLTLRISGHHKLHWTLRFPLLAPSQAGNIRRFSAAPQKYGLRGHQALAGAIRYAVPFNYSAIENTVLQDVPFHGPVRATGHSLHIADTVQNWLRTGAPRLFNHTDLMQPWLRGVQIPPALQRYFTGELTMSRLVTLIRLHCCRSKSCSGAGCPSLAGMSVAQRQKTQAPMVCPSHLPPGSHRLVRAKVRGKGGGKGKDKGAEQGKAKGKGKGKGEKIKAKGSDWDPLADLSPDPASVPEGHGNGQGQRQRERKVQKVGTISVPLLALAPALLLVPCVLRGQRPLRCAPLFALHPQLFHSTVIGDSSHCGALPFHVSVLCITGPTPSIEGGLKVNLKPPLKPPLKVLALDLKA